MQPAAVDALREHAARLGREVHDAGDLGVGVEFADGNDALWLLDDRVVTTLPADVDPDEAIAIYDRVDRLRDGVVRVVRHHLAHKKYGVDRSRNGVWSYEAGPVSGSIGVGIRLTRLALDAAKDATVYDVLTTWSAGQWIGKTPSPKRTRRFLDTPLPPAGERPLDYGDEEEDEEDDEPRQTIAGVVGMLGLCRGLDALPEQATADDLRRLGEPQGRIGRALLRLGERLPTASASFDLLKPGTLSIRFADDYDDLPIHAKSRAFVARVKAAESPEAAGDALADEFLRTQSHRRRMLASLFDVARERGLGLERLGRFVSAGGGASAWLGRETREIGVNLERRLTAAVARYNPPIAVRRWLHDAPTAFVDEVAKRLALLPEDATPVEPPERSLLPAEVPAAPPLPELSADRVAGADGFARRTIAKFWRKPDLHKYHDRDFYEPPDDWASPSDWLAVAERGETWQLAVRVLIYRDAGDPRADELGPQVLQWHDAYDGNSDDQAEVAWLYRDRDVAKAREWFAEPSLDELQHAEVRSRHGDPIALRHLRFAPQRDDLDDGELDPNHLSVDERQALHRRLLRQAATQHRWSGGGDELLKPALLAGWIDVARALESNPFLLPGLLTIDRRHDGLDEPGALLATNLLLKWSRLDPSPFLARLILAICETDLVALAVEAGRRGARGRRDVLTNLPSSTSIYKAWNDDLQLPLAIAWQRCRAAGVGEELATAASPRPTS